MEDVLYLISCGGYSGVLAEAFNIMSRWRCGSQYRIEP